MKKEQMNIVIAGHVDHGKSTVIGRLLADTRSLPEGRLEAVRANCAKNAKPFEYAFLLDALKDEQAQGITIDSARCFFKTEKRNYIVLDAPGHIEFLKNMITGAAHAEAALLVIDALEGVQENSKRHGYLISMLGIKSVVVLVNKMDLVDYDEERFNSICAEYTEFLTQISVEPISFVPISAFQGINLVGASKEQTPWYKGISVLEQLDALESHSDLEGLPFRFPVQDIYKFTESGDQRRIFAGSVATGTIKVGDAVTFFPSKKQSTVASIEGFNLPAQQETHAGRATGFTLSTQIYVQPGEIMVRQDEDAPQVSSSFRANVFWMGKTPLQKNKTYKLKIGTRRAFVDVVDILKVVDASNLESLSKNEVERHEVGECIFESTKPLAFDASSDIEATGRFVIVDNYEISGGGIVIESVESQETVLDAHVRERELSWKTGYITPMDRATSYCHRSQFIVIAGPFKVGKRDIARILEQKLFKKGIKSYYLGLTNFNSGMDSDMIGSPEERNELIRRLGEVARIMTGAGLIFITTLSNVDDYDLERLQTLTQPHKMMVFGVGAQEFLNFDETLHLMEHNTKENVRLIYKKMQDSYLLHAPV